MNIRCVFHLAGPSWVYIVIGWVHKSWGLRLMEGIMMADSDWLWPRSERCGSYRRDLTVLRCSCKNKVMSSQVPFPSDWSFRSCTDITCWTMGRKPWGLNLQVLWVRTKSSFHAHWTLFTLKLSVAISWSDVQCSSPSDSAFAIWLLLRAGKCIGKLKLVKCRWDTDWNELGVWIDVRTGSEHSLLSWHV